MRLKPDLLATPGVAIAWHLRLEARLMLSVTLMVGAALGGLFLVTERVVTHDALERVRETQNAAKLAFDQLVDTRATFAAAQIRLIAELPVFRAHLIQSSLLNDTATIEAMAD